MYIYSRYCMAHDKQKAEYNIMLTRKLRANYRTGYWEFFLPIRNLLGLFRRIGGCVCEIRERCEMSKLSFKTFCIEYYAEHTKQSSEKVYEIFKDTKLLDLLDSVYVYLHGM